MSVSRPNIVFIARVILPVAKAIGALAQSAARYPHIKPGEEFTGYERQTTQT
jgi:hypothetical protein